MRLRQGSNRGTLLPVTGVSWHDVVIWTNAYSEKDGLVPVYRDTKGNVLKDARALRALDNVVKSNNRYWLPAVALLKNVVQSNNNEYRLPTEEEGEMPARWLDTTAPTKGSLAKDRIATTGKDGKTFYWTPGN